MRPDAHSLIIDVPVAESLRRQIGPTAWVVLETLAESSRQPTGVAEVDASVRDLAALTGLSKDTVARAIRRLFDACVVNRVDMRDERSGRFGRSIRRVDLDAAGLSVERASTRTTPGAPSSEAANHAPGVHDRPDERPRNSAQLSLLDAGH